MPAYGWEPWSPGDKVTPYNYESYNYWKSTHPGWDEKTGAQPSGWSGYRPPGNTGSTEPDAFDAAQQEVKAKQEIGMRLGFRSAYMIGARGLEGQAYSVGAYDRWNRASIFDTGTGKGPDNRPPAPPAGGRPPAPGTKDAAAMMPVAGPGDGGGGGGVRPGGPGTPPAPRPPPPNGSQPGDLYDLSTWVIGAGGLTHPLLGSPRSQLPVPPQNPGGVIGVPQLPSEPSLTGGSSPGLAGSQFGTTFLTSDNPDDVLARLSRAKRVQGMAR